MDEQEKKQISDELSKKGITVDKKKIDISISRYVESALTTDEPTPCNPPLVL